MIDTDRIEVRGLKAWARPDDRSHHLDLTLDVGPRRFRACILAPDERSYTVRLYDDAGRGAVSNGDEFWGSIEEAIVSAMLYAIDGAKNPRVFEHDPLPAVMA